MINLELCEDVSLKNKEFAINDIYNRILNVRSYIKNTNIKPEFTREMRINILKMSISYFEENEEYDKCSKLMKILNTFDCVWFNTQSYK
jgi:hypothetical protein